MSTSSGLFNCFSQALIRRNSCSSWNPSIRINSWINSESYTCPFSSVRQCGKYSNPSHVWELHPNITVLSDHVVPNNSWPLRCNVWLHLSLVNVIWDILKSPVFTITQLFVNNSWMRRETGCERYHCVCPVKTLRSLAVMTHFGQFQLPCALGLRSLFNWPFDATNMCSARCVSTTETRSAGETETDLKSWGNSDPGTCAFCAISFNTLSDLDLTSVNS